MAGLVVDKAIIRDAALRVLNRDAGFDESKHPRKGGKFTAGGKTAEEHHSAVEHHMAKQSEARDKARASSGSEAVQHNAVANAHSALADHHAEARNNLENAGHGGSNPTGKLKIAEKAAKKAADLHERSRL